MSGNIEKISEVFVKNKAEFEKMLGIKLNFFPQSIVKLENALNEMFPFGREISAPVSIIVGFYLGEVIRKNAKKQQAKWEENPNDLFDSSLSFTTKDNFSFSIKPLIRVDKFLNHDRTDGLYAMYCMTQDLINNRIDLEQESTWKHSPRGYSYRFHKVDKKSL